MRKILVLCLALFAAGSLMAQQKSKTAYMGITIYEYHGLEIGHVHNMVITRTDTAQVQKDIDLKFHGKAREYLLLHEDTLMSALKPYFKTGWILVSTSVESGDFSGNSNSTTYRYYFKREE